MKEKLVFTFMIVSLLGLFLNFLELTKREQLENYDDDFYILKCKKLANICILKCKNLINDKYLFEVGGKKKNFDQIADVANSFLAVDDTEVGYGNRIPLWMFGMVY